MASQIAETAPWKLSKSRNFVGKTYNSLICDDTRTDVCCLSTSVVCLWAIVAQCGQSMERVWTWCERSVDKVWTECGLNMDGVGTECGQSKEMAAFDMSYYGGFCDYLPTLFL